MSFIRTNHRICPNKPRQTGIWGLFS